MSCLSIVNKRFLHFAFAAVLKPVSNFDCVFHWIGFLLILHATSKDVCNKQERICKGILTRSEEISFPLFFFIFFFSSGVLHFMNIMINAIKRMDPHGDIGNWKKRKIFSGKLVFELLNDWTYSWIHFQSLSQQTCFHFYLNIKLDHLLIWNW